MTSYDFRNLNDKEFELLCTDLLGESEGVRYEQFKQGRDQGIDGRFFSPLNGTTILQCKHWIGSPFSTLLRRLREEELPKVTTIAPDRYVLAVSTPLSPHQKEQIRESLSPHIRSCGDILGADDLNALLRKHEHVAQRHYKLWINSTAVLRRLLHADIHTRASVVLKEIHAAARLYVETPVHIQARSQLERNHVIVLSGAPGVGKTTLAQQVALEAVAAGYDFVDVASIEDAERSLTEGRLQVFYFDDFLGESYLNALSGNTGARISSFIRLVRRSADKRLILTSRSGILNMGAATSSRLAEVNLDPNRLEVEVSALSRIDRARILYNHLWHAGLESKYVDKLYEHSRYRNIIDHRNFNPRLIAFICDPLRLRSVHPELYWHHVMHLLDNPADVWDQSFHHQLDDYGRLLVRLVVSNGGRILETHLRAAYSRFLAIASRNQLSGHREFVVSEKLLVGAMLNRIVDPARPTTLTVYNPSLSDYVLPQICADTNFFHDCIISLGSKSAVETVARFMKSGMLSRGDASALGGALLKSVTDDIVSFDRSFVASVCVLHQTTSTDETRDKSNLRNCMSFLLADDLYVSSDTLFLAAEALGRSDLAQGTAKNLAKKAIDSIAFDDDIRSVSSLVYGIDDDDPEKQGLMDQFEQRVFEIAEDDIDGFCDVAAVLSGIWEHDEHAAWQALTDSIERRLDELEVYPGDPDFAKELLRRYNIADALRRHGIRDDEYDDAYVSRSSSYNWAISESSDVDDLFSRP
ncbi:nSTAND3 domain-containing NTPase [Luteibacter jiangsuensis]